MSQWPDFMVGQANKPVRVFLVDDDAHLRYVVARELMVDPRVQLDGQTGGVREAKRAMRQEVFNVLLADLNLQDGCGLELISL